MAEQENPVSDVVQSSNAVQPTPNPQLTPAQPLFKRLASNQRQGLLSGIVQKGSIVIASYKFAKHDRNPLILVSAMYNDGRVAGVNLHYVAYTKLIETIKKYSTNVAGFSWQLIKGDVYLAKAFRTYKKQGLFQAKVLNKQFIIDTLKQARTFDPNEHAAIRQSITNVIRQAVNPRADQVSRDMSSVNQQSATIPTTGTIAPIAGQPASY